MKPGKLAEAVNLAEKAGHVLIATADERGMPHVTAAARIALAGEETVAVTEWFCPGTVANLQKNRSVSIVVWEGKPDNGFQLLGRLEKVEDVGVLDGYAPGREDQHPMPQVEKQLLVKVEKILDFRLGPHSDVEE
jgi:hypothetical protein